MALKRLALITSMAALALAPPGSAAGASAATGQASQAGPAGLSYAASTPGFEREAWLRLGPKRLAIASVWIDYFAPARRCSRGQGGYVGSFLSGYEWDEHIATV